MNVRQMAYGLKTLKVAIHQALVFLLLAQVRHQPFLIQREEHLRIRPPLKT
ncbi:hypothetical protein D3C84_1128820 [compost metagenome]